MSARKSKPQRKSQRIRKYFTLDNGGRPFLVYVRTKDVHIYKMPSEVENAFYDEGCGAFDCRTRAKMDPTALYTELIVRIPFKKIFIGKSPDN